MQKLLIAKGVMKADELRKTIIDDYPNNDKLVKKLRNVFDREKFMKLSSSNFN